MSSRNGQPIETAGVIDQPIVNDESYINNLSAQRNFRVDINGIGSGDCSVIQSKEEFQLASIDHIVITTRSPDDVMQFYSSLKMTPRTLGVSFAFWLVESFTAPFVGNLFYLSFIDSLLIGPL